MIQTVQNWIWNIGGLLFTISLFFLLIAWIISIIINKLMCWTTKENRQIVFHFIKNKKRIMKIVEEERTKEEV